MTAKVLVADDILANVRLMEAKLTAAHYAVVTAFNGAEALAKAQSERPDLILLDIMMPGMNGYEACARLKADPELAHIPVVMITALDDLEHRVRGLEAGADDFLTKPANDIALWARVRSLVRMKLAFDELRLRDGALRALSAAPATNRTAEPGPHAWDADASAPESRVVLFEENPLRRRALADRLRALGGVRLEIAETSDAALELGLADRTDLFLIDAGSDGAHGARLSAELRAHPQARHAGILLIVDEGAHQIASAGLDIGATDYLMRPVEPTELAARVRSQLRRKRQEDRLRAAASDGARLAVTDGLTGLYNRRYADQYLDDAFARARGASGGGAPADLAVLIVDIDHFKSVNDTFGHAMGDAVIREVAQRMREELRGVDLVARFGGEEFVAALPESDAMEAMEAAERLRIAIEKTPFARPDALGPGPALRATASIGVAALSEADAAPAALLSRADAALYAAKRGGRNQTRLASAIAELSDRLQA